MITGTMASLGRKLAAGVLAALVAGVCLGSLARGLMALLALVAEGSSTFSWSGSSFILIVFVLVMLPGGVVAGLTARRWRWLLPVAGAAFLCVPAVGVAQTDIGATTDLGPGQWLGVAAGAVGIFGAIGLLPLLTVRLADRWLGRSGAVRGQARAA